MACACCGWRSRGLRCPFGSRDAPRRSRPPGHVCTPPAHAVVGGQAHTGSAIVHVPRGAVLHPAALACAALRPPSNSRSAPPPEDARSAPLPWLTTTRALLPCSAALQRRPPPPCAAAASPHRRSAGLPFMDSQANMPPLRSPLPSGASPSARKARTCVSMPATSIRRSLPSHHSRFVAVLLLPAVPPCAVCASTPSPPQMPRQRRC